MDELATDAARQGDNPEIVAILEGVCKATGMGFAAVARVTEDRWIAFGMNPGDELEIQKTICSQVRAEGCRVIIDDVRGDPDWRTHPVPILYGFKSYVSLPLTLEDGSFFGTLCAIDPKPRVLSTGETVEVLQDCARRLARILSGPSA
jgi:GAF domain-containing protein